MLLLHCLPHLIWRAWFTFLVYSMETLTFPNLLYHALLVDDHSRGDKVPDDGRTATKTTTTKIEWSMRPLLECKRISPKITSADKETRFLMRKHFPSFDLISWPGKEKEWADNKSIMRIIHHHFTITMREEQQQSSLHPLTLSKPKPRWKGSVAILLVFLSLVTAYKPWEMIFLLQKLRLRESLRERHAMQWQSLVLGWWWLEWNGNVHQQTRIGIKR